MGILAAMLMSAKTLTNEQYIGIYKYVNAYIRATPSPDL